MSAAALGPARTAAEVQERELFSKIEFAGARIRAISDLLGAASHSELNGEHTLGFATLIQSDRCDVLDDCLRELRQLRAAS